MADRTDPIDPYVAAFEAGRPDRAAEPAFLREARDAAAGSFAERGFPRRDEEDWRSTSVAPLTRRPFSEMAAHANCLTPERVAEAAYLCADACRLVFVNGRLSEALSSPAGLPRGVRVSGLADALAREPEAVEPHLARLAAHADHPFVALNTAFFRDGAYVRIPRDLALQKPIFVVHVVVSPEAAAVVHPRGLFVAEAGAQATIIESYLGLSEDAYWSNPVTELVGEPGSVLVHAKIQREGASAYHFGTTAARIERDASVASHSVSVGGVLVRHDVTALLADEGADCKLHGLYLLGGRQHEDNHTVIDHAKPHGTSRELYKGILADQAHGVFHGGIIVREDAQKTNARQANNNLLLSDDALVDTKPQLEIFADDVKCAHGATVGQLDEESLFYLRSRGIEPESARDILIQAFAREILEQIPADTARAGLESELLARLPVRAPEAS